MPNTIPFGEWLPDLPPYGLKGATIATNVLPEAASYRPFPSLVAFTTSLSSKVVGGIFATDAASNNYNYVGLATSLHQVVGGSFSNVSRLAGGAYTTNSEDFWEFVNWGNTVIGVNGFADYPQQISLGAANFADLNIGIKAKHICTMKDFVVLGNISDSAANVYRVRWSAINNPTSFTPNITTLSDYQDLPSEGGPIQKIVGGEYSVIFQKRSIWRMLFVGIPLIFQFDRVHNLIGAYAPQAVSRYQNLVFFLSEDGFYSFDGNDLDPIGRGKVDQFFFADLSTTHSQRINSAIDPTNKLIMWAYPSNSTIGGNPDKIICYSWAFKRWSLVEGINITYFFQTITTGYTLEGLDAITTNLDNLTSPLDSVQWTGGQIIMSAFNAVHQLARFNGSAMAATIETGEFQLFPDSRAMITEVRPNTIGLSASATIAVMNRNNLTESVSVGSVSAFPNSTGFVQTRCSSRYFRIRLTTAVNTNFTHLVGVEVSGVPAGVR